MERLAEAIAKSRLFGMATPEQALVLMAIAQAEGRHPALAPRDYDIIQNKPVKKSEAMLRDFQSAGGSVEWHQLDDTMADATFFHPTVPKGARISWDMARAQRAELTRNPTWKKFSRAMLRSRCVSEGVKTVFPAATGGMYVPEEQAEIEPEVIENTAAVLTEFAANTPIAQIDVPDEPFADLEFIATAEAKAGEGTAAFRTWWRGLIPASRNILKGRLSQLEVIADAADAAKADSFPGAASQPAPEPEPAPAPTGKETPLREPPGLQPPQGTPIIPAAPYTFADDAGEAYEFSSALDAAQAYCMLLDACNDEKQLDAIWKTSPTLRAEMRGNGNLLGEIDAAYVKAKDRIAKGPQLPTTLDGQARAMARKGIRQLHNWWLKSITPEQRKELQPRLREYEAIAKELV
jgi:hypothetical protein